MQAATFDGSIHVVVGDVAVIRHRVGGRWDNGAAAAAWPRHCCHNHSRCRWRYRRCCHYRSSPYYCYTPSSYAAAATTTSASSSTSRDGFMRGQRRTARQRGSQRDRLSNYWTLWTKEEAEK